MKNFHKSIKAFMAVTVLAATMSLTSCDVMLDVLGGMAMGMASYNPYGYNGYTAYTDNSYLLDPNYAMWQVQNGIVLGGTGESSSSSSTSTGSTTGGTTTKTHKCGLCGGSGRTVKTDGLSFGNNKYCSECGKTVGDYHYHSKCESCGGKGYW